MFEQDAKDMARKLEESQVLGVYSDGYELECAESYNCGEVMGYEDGFQKGAEHGYHSRDKEVSELENEIALLKAKNKGFENLISGLLVKYEEFYKRFPDLGDARKGVEKLLESTQWHYVKDGDLPKDESRVWLYFGVDDYNDGQFIRGRFWCGSCGWFDVEEVIAWKEIIPPTEN